MISKELLSEVLGVKVYFIYDELNNGCIEYELKSDKIYSINIYELAYKCKEWAMNECCVFIVYLTNMKKYNEIQIDIKLGKEWKVINSKKYTEPEAIFKACEWILKESK